MTRKRKYNKSHLRPAIGWKAAADELGVTSPHLFLVVNGQRHSARLMKRYNDLLKGGAR